MPWRSDAKTGGAPLRSGVRRVRLRFARRMARSRRLYLKAYNLVPPGANFGFDVMVYCGKALWQWYRNELEVVAELLIK